MRIIYFSLALIVYVHRVQSVSPCDSKFCVCRFDVKSDRDLFSETVDCSHDPKVLQREYVLPDTVYSLDLSWNNLTRITSTKLFLSETLIELDISHNRITDIDLKLFNMPKLKTLNLSYNRLEFIKTDIFKKINQLQYLNLANNRFTHFDQLTLHPLGNLIEIILDNNNLGSSLEDANLFDRNGYGITNKIQSLSISGINLQIVPDNFFVDAYDLRRLNIARNNLTNIFELPFTLEYLDLSDNPIEEISGEDFADLVALKELKLNNLLISEVPDYAFASLHALVDLELERNRNLTSFSATAFGQEVLDDPDDFALEKLSLKGSRLQTLDEKLEVPFGQLLRLDLQGNVWNCDCNIAWIKRLQITPTDYEHLRCFTPKQLFNSRIFDLNQKYFACKVNNQHIGVGIGVVITCIVLTALAFWLFTYSSKLQSMSHFIRNMNMPTTEYTVLPVHTSLRDF